MSFSFPKKLSATLIFCHIMTNKKVSKLYTVKGRMKMSKVEPAVRTDFSSMVRVSQTFKNDVPGAGEQRDKEALFMEEIGEDKRPTVEEVREAVNRINETMELYRTELRFVLHEESGEIMVKVINAETQEVIREIPPEWALKIVASVKKMLGLILDRFI